MKQAVDASFELESMTMSSARDRGMKMIQKAILNVGVVEQATGVSADREGNVYVVQISADGSKVREILTSKDETAI